MVFRVRNRSRSLTRVETKIRYDLPLKADLGWFSCSGRARVGGRFFLAKSPHANWFWQYALTPFRWVRRSILSEESVPPPEKAPVKIDEGIFHPHGVILHLPRGRVCNVSRRVQQQMNEDLVHVHHDCATVGLNRKTAKTGLAGFRKQRRFHPLASAHVAESSQKAPHRVVRYRTAAMLFRLQYSATVRWQTCRLSLCLFVYQKVFL